jgi:hypothetical protein
MPQPVRQWAVALIARRLSAAAVGWSCVPWSALV